ncbi:MAG: glycosyltransferase family 2 protein [Nitrospiraceae bacterium]
MTVDTSRTWSNVEVSVIVPCRAEEDSIEECMRSILDQEPLPERFEVIAADGMSTDRTCDILRRLALEDSRLRVIDNPGRMVSSGLNAAIAIARGQFILRMDAHTVYAKDYVSQCIAVLRQTGADNVGGPALTWATSYVQKAIAAAFHSPFAVGGARFHDPHYEGYVDTVPYGCWPREVFSRIGLFDEELVRNQDDEFNLRLVRFGGKIWQSPQIKSWYRTRGTLTELFRQYRQYGYWKVRVIQKHHLPASIRHVVPAGFILSLNLLLLASLWWPSVIWGFIGLLGLYLASLLVASFATAGRKQWKLLPILPMVFATYHFSYGLGFLRGIWDFVIVRRSPPQSLVNVSRRSAIQSPRSVAPAVATHASTFRENRPPAL